MADASQPLKWFYIYAREINDETYYLCDDLEPIRNRPYGVRVHPIKEAYEFVGCLQNRRGSSLEEFVDYRPAGDEIVRRSGPHRVVGGWMLEE